MSAPIDCPRCGHGNAAASKFCGQCAAPLGAAPPAEASPAIQPPDAPAPTLSRPRSSGGGAKRVRPIILIAVFAAVVPIGAMMLMGGGLFGSGTVEGELRSSGQPYGDYSVRPTSCFSGEHESFFGVWVTPDLTEDAEGRTGFKGGLKIVKSHVGEWEIYVESPLECQSFNCVIRPLDPEHCNVFQVDVHNTNTTVNDIRVREGTVDLECAPPEGGTFVAHLVFDGCS